MGKSVIADRQRVVEQIVEYLAANPHAADTLDGIQSWWLSGATSGTSRSEVEHAVRVLLQDHVLECRMLPDGTRIYARAPHE